MDKARKIAVIGLDCASPELLFDRWRNDLPCLASLMSNGTWGRLQSVTPPITVPAWSCMVSGKDPGELGIYGFRNRKDYSYTNLTISNSTAVREQRVWDILGRAGKKVIVFGVPGTFPPSQVNGCMISCFLTPNAEAVYTYPTELKSELESRFGPYRMDVKNFRSEDKIPILDQIYEMTNQHFAMAEYLVTSREWDFFMMVEMGTDRIHHAFWKFCDAQHSKYVPGNPFEGVIHAYYCHLDKQIARFLGSLDPGTAVFIVSDHGAKKMDGGICVNEWMKNEGYLTLHEEVNKPTPLSKVSIDWPKTIAWGDGGYYCRIFLNVKDREPQGLVEPDNYEVVRNEIKLKLEGMLNREGKLLGTRAFKPQEIYRAVRGIPPDLIVYFGNLSWRSVASMGTGDIYTIDNDTGPDDANHAEYGIFILRDSGTSGEQNVSGLRLFDVSATILDRFGMTVPPDMQGQPVRRN